MPMELHHLNDEVPGSSPGGSNMWGHSSMVEHEVSSKPCRRTLIIAIADGGRVVEAISIIAEDRAIMLKQSFGSRPIRPVNTCCFILGLREHPRAKIAPSFRRGLFWNMSGA